MQTHGHLSTKNKLRRLSASFKIPATGTTGSWSQLIREYNSAKDSFGCFSNHSLTGPFQICQNLHFCSRPVSNQPKSLVLYHQKHRMTNQSVQDSAHLVFDYLEDRHIHVYKIFIFHPDFIGQSWQCLEDVGIQQLRFIYNSTHFVGHYLLSSSKSDSSSFSALYLRMIDINKDAPTTQTDLSACHASDGPSKARPGGLLILAGLLIGHKLDIGWQGRLPTANESYWIHLCYTGQKFTSLKPALVMLYQQSLHRHGALMQHNYPESSHVKRFMLYGTG